MKFRLGTLFAVLFFCMVHAGAQTTAFTYQGSLSDGGSPANGGYDLRFALYNTNVSGTIVAGPVTNSAVAVTNGLFTVSLDFGASVFDGSDRWLQVAVRTNGSGNAFVALSPLQRLASTPYSIRSLAAASAMVLTAPLQATNVSGVIPVANLPRDVAFLDSNQTFTAANTFNGVVTAANSANSFSGAFNGNGGGLTNVPATSLTGTLPDARLSANVALQSNPNIVFAGTVTATNYVGAGHGLTNVPGAFFWVTTSASSIQSYPNVGYLCENDTTPVTVLLPPSPAVGDVVKIAGVGDAGWHVGQNANQNILAGNLVSGVGQSWKPAGSSLNWSAIASSSDGTKLAATTVGYIYTSTDAGATWTQQTQAGSQYWSSIASSADGTHLIACVGPTPYNASSSGYIYLSSNSGVTWGIAGLGYPTAYSWTAVASSADGSKLFAALDGGQIGYSANGGSSWSLGSGTASYNWTAVACSSDGSRVVAAENNGRIFTSSNSGANWGVATNTNPTVSWSAVASSSDGTRLVAGGNAGQIYLSTDSGANWSQVASLGAGVTGLAMSADGSRILAATGASGVNSSLYTSSDSGVLWTPAPAAPQLSWAGAASSADGSVLAAVPYGGNIYVSSQRSTTTGTTGYLAGPQHSAIQLIYIGSGTFLPLSHEGTIRAY
ncbi:MAG: hypothetical protein KGR98_01900 [Verrucomicrobia bacterium]|nr:hypothetical protein [Verrucomicrobiota bacterium]MDE3099125.1 hypothetical protein [Verrucomicrobiota bacterium]